MEDAVVINDENNNDDSLASDIDPHQNNIMENEGVDRMGNETEDREIKGVEYKNEGMESDNKGVVNKVIPPERKIYILGNPTNVNYNDKTSTELSMGWNNLIVGSNDFQSVSKAYVNIVNAITYLVKPTTPTNIITNNIILKQYSIKQGIKVFYKTGEASV